MKPTLPEVFEFLAKEFYELIYYESPSFMQLDEKQLKEIVGARVAALRALHGLSQEEFGALFGIRQTLIQKYERGHIMIPPLFVMKICARYGVSWNWIYGGITAGLDPQFATNLTGSLATILAKNARKAKRKNLNPIPHE